MTGERDFSQFTKRELRDELVSIIDMLPTSVERMSAENNRVSDVGADRMDVEERSTLEDRFVSILLRSHYTPALQEFLTTRFSYSVIFGEGLLDEHVFNEESLHYMLDLDADSLGPFDPVDARESARKIINQQLKIDLAIVEDLNASRLDQSDEIDEPDELLVAARREFIEKYGEEP